MDLISYIPSFGNFLFTMGAFVLALLVIISIHEFGHYIVGRWSGIHAEVFSLGFGPVLWSRRDKHGTKWQLAAVPFGGYVKFLGDADAASGKDVGAIGGLSQEEKRHTMHGAPLWARTLTVAAGPVFNFILSIVVFTGIGLSLGVSEYPPRIDTLHDLPAAHELLPGDKLLAINGVDYPDEDGFGDFIDSLPAEPTLDYTVDRGGETLVVQGPPLAPARVANMTPGWAAERAGFLVGDVILSINGQDVYEFGEMIPLINNTKGTPVDIRFWRDGTVQTQTLTAQRRDLPLPDNGFETRYVLGIGSSYFFTPAARAMGPVDAAKFGVQRTWGIITQSLSGTAHILRGAISSCNISGPVGIARVSGQMASQGTVNFLFFIAMLSTAVGLMNLFPIPILDGGHLVFFAYEAITGRPPSDGALRILMGAGLALILGLMVFAVTNDFLCP